MGINSLSSLFHQPLLPHVEVVEQEIIHQWDVNDFVVCLIKKQDVLGKDILEYKTIQNQIEIYTEHIEIPESKSLERMISQLKACKIMLDENGMATFSRNYHTWENTPNLNAECEYRDTEVNLIRGSEGLVWNVFQRITKESSFYSLQEATTPSLRCHPETIALIEKIKKEAFKNPQIQTCLMKDFKVSIIDSETIKKEYKAIKADLKECEEALMLFKAIKSSEGSKSFVEQYRKGMATLQTLSLKANNSQVKDVIDLKNLKKEYEELKAALEECKQLLKVEKSIATGKSILIGSIGLYGVAPPLVYLAKNSIDAAASCVKNYLGNPIIGSLAGNCTRVISGSAVLFSAVFIASLVSLPFFPQETGLDTNKLDSLKKRMIPLSLQKPLLIEVEPISAPSLIDERVRVSKFTWAVTLVTNSGTSGNHAEIIVEGINDGFYDQEAPRIGAAQKVGIGEKFIHLADYSPRIQSGLLSPDDLKYETRSEIWMVSSNKVKKMLEAIEKEKYLPADQRRPFNLWGIGSKIYKYSPKWTNPFSCSGKSGDNCFTWARDQLKMIDIDLGEGYMDYITAMAKNYTRNKEEYKTIPIQEMI